MVTRFILVRHGQTAWNREERFRGRAEVPLDEIGQAQAAATGRRIAAEWRPTAVYCSPMVRARQTAEAIARPLGLAIQQHRGLNDIDFGELQGLTLAEAGERWGEIVTSWFHRPEVTHFPGGEGLADLRARAARMVDELTGRHAGDTVVLVGHTVINRVILLDVLGLGNDRFWRLAQDTCAINVFEAEAGDFTVISLNDTCHLRPTPCLKDIAPDHLPSG